MTTEPQPPPARPSCARCHGATEDGYLLDRPYTRVVVADTGWVAGPVRHGLLGGAKPGDQPRYKVLAQRCTHCGHLELYARQRTY